MDAREICRYNKFGHCKYRSSCRNIHIEILCNIQNCKISSCEMRHPIMCKYFLQYGRCKFDPCSYRHERVETQKIKDLEDRVQHYEKKLQDLEFKLEEKSVEIEDLNSKVEKLLLFLKKTSFDTVPTNEPAVVSIASSKSFPVGLPPHKQMDQFGYPKCWQRDFRPTCCNHIHDPGRGGRNVPPDLSQCCHHTCGG